jgi:hypothetical protein
MEAACSWKDFFRQWPADMPRRGVLIVAFGEQIPFSGFSPSEAFLLIERQSPDAVGGRTVVLSYDKILGLKFVDVVKAGALQSLGFHFPNPK